MTIQQDLLRACAAGNTEQVEALLRHPEIDVNQSVYVNNVENVFLRITGEPQTSYTGTPLAIACCARQLEIVKLLLADERVHVNAESGFMCEPFREACLSKNTEIIELFLARDETEVNLGYNAGETFFGYLCREAKTEADIKIINLLLVDGRVNIYEKSPIKQCLKSSISECNFPVTKQLLAFHSIRSDKNEINPATVIDMLFELTGEEAVQDIVNQGGSRQLLEDYFKTRLPNILPNLENEIATLQRQINKHKIERKMPLVADLFALFVLLSDDFLKLQNDPQDEPTKKTMRFFTLAKKSSMDLQMVLANRSLGSSWDVVPPGHVDSALRRQIKKLA